ncbi:MAG: hypothetical protein LBD35_04565 [Prevotellaceae bacterium]|jgi:hypothetical protein|nr:hypothetical protein [Prevotellaceae bacterium]
MFLYLGLSLMLLAFAFKLTANMSDFWFRLLAGIAIALKLTFLVLTFRAKGFKANRGLYFILTGVGVMLVSLLLKATVDVPALHRTLFFVAILLKITGVIIMAKKIKN